MNTTALQTLSTELVKGNQQAPIQLVTISELVDIIKNKGGYELASICYFTKDSRASSKTPFWKLTKNTIAFGVTYKSKLEKASSIEGHEAKPKQSTTYNLDSDSNKIGYSVKDNAPMIVYTFPKETEAVKTHFFNDEKGQNEISFETAFEMMTPSGQKRALNQTPKTSTQELAQIETEKEFNWQTLRLENLIAIKMRGTIYLINKL